MAERQYVIRIENNTSGGAGDKVGGAGGISRTNKTTPTSRKSDTDQGAKAAKAFLRQAGVPLTGMAAYGTVRKITNEIVSHNNSLIYVKTGSREAQERQTFIYNTSMGFVDSLVMGASGGFAVAGLPGAAIGALIGVVSQGLNMGINYTKTSDTLAKNRQLENIQRDLQAQRVTTNGSRYMTASQM